MTKNPFRTMLLAAAALVLGAGGVLLAQEITSSAGPVTHVFAVTTSDTATYANPSGALMPMPETSVKINVARPSLVTIHFSARGTVQPSGSQIIPIVFVECQLDGVACEPDSNPVEFLYPQFCCDTRAFQWAVHRVAAGSHTVDIFWGMGNPTSADVSNRSLVVQTATLE